MEENKKKESKMSYEDLQNIATQLSNQNTMLRKQIEEINMVNVFKRLDYLFKVVENINSFDATFSGNCIKEIEDIMTIKKENNETK